MNHILPWFKRTLLFSFFAITLAQTGNGQQPMVGWEQAINENEGGGIPDLGGGDWFGYALSPIGDINLDGIPDLAVGAPYTDDDGSNTGAVYVLFMDANGQVETYQKISNTAGGLQSELVDDNFFGSEITNIGDLDGNGINDLVIGANGDDDIAGWSGALWVLFMNSDGTVLSEQKISGTVGWPGSPLASSDRFGKGLDSIGDINGDGVNDIMAGVHEDDDGGTNHGAVYVLMLNSDGTVQSHTKISEITPGFNATLSTSAGLGWSVACLGDLNNDGNTEVLVSSPFDNVLTSDDGRVWIMSISSTGNLVANTEISAAVSSVLAPYISNGDKFGSAVARGFSMWCDSEFEIVVGSMNYGSPSVGGVLLIGLDESFQVNNVQVITEGEANFQDNLSNQDKFGRALDLVTDYDGNGYPDLFVGAVNFGNSGGTWLVSVDPVENPSVLPDSIQFCETSTYELFPSVPVNNILWSTGSIADTILLQQTDLHWLEGTIGNCTINDTVMVVANDLPELSLGSDTLVCEPVFLSVHLPGYNTDWNTGSSQDSILVSASGSFWVTVDGICGLFSDTVTIEIPDNLVFNLGSDTIICNGTELVLTPEIISGLPNSYMWYNGSAQAADTVNTEGNYWLTVADECSVLSDSIFVSLGYEPTVAVVSDTLVCASSLNIEATAQTYGNHTASWSTGDIGLTATIDSSGIYYITLQDLCGAATDSIAVTMFNAVSIELPPDTTICTSDEIELVPIATWEEITAFQWNGGATDTTQIVAAGEYWIEATTNCGVIADTVEISSSVGPALTLGPDTSLCAISWNIEPNIESFIGALSFQWNTGELSSSLTIDSSGVYILEGTDICGIASDSIEVEIVNGIDSVFLLDQYFVCEDDTIELLAEVSNPTSEVTWSTGEVGLSIPVSSSSLYSASVTNACGTDSDSTYVYSASLQQPYMSWEYLACGSMAMLRIDSLEHYTGLMSPLQPTYEWSTGATDTSIIISQSGTYWLEKTGYCGVDSVSISLELSDCWNENIPNIITPNSDGINDIFVPVFESCYSCPYRLQVFNRWGFLIFDDQTLPWNGMLKSGSPATSGVYYYVLTLGGNTHQGYLEVIP